MTTILSLQYCKLNRQSEEAAEEWMGRFRIKAAEFRNKETDRHLKEQLINRINDDTMIVEIIKRNTGHQRYRCHNE